MMKTPEAYAPAVAAGHDGRPPRRIGGRTTDILYAFLIMTVPMVCFSGLLIGLVYRFRIVPNDFVSRNLMIDSGQTDPNAFLVQISATTLILVASWSSTVAPILTGFAITLVTYPVARGILKSSERNDAARLPTPYQLALLLQMRTDSSPASLWGWLKYSLGWSGPREKQVQPIKTVSGTLVLGVVLSILIFAADTWLHFSTKTISFSQVQLYSNPSGLSFGLYANCTNVNQTYYMGCNLNNPASGTTLLHSGALRVLSNISDSMAVDTYAAGNMIFAYLASAQASRLASVDYTAASVAVQSQCTPVTSKCFDKSRVAGVGAPFQCPFAFQGFADTSTTASNSVTMAYFTDPSGNNNRTSAVSLANPYYFATVAVANMRNPPSTTLISDPEILKGQHGGSTIIGLFCNATVYNVEYDSINGTITRFLAVPSNSSLVNLIQGSQQFTSVGTANLVQAASVAGLGDSAQGIADQFALSYSQTALAVASDGFEPRDALESQERQEILVAQVPKAPLGCLLAANLMVAVLGIVLTVVAIFSASGETGEIQARLSIRGLVAAHFEGGRAHALVEKVDHMFEERHGGPGSRVGFARTAQGGWALASWQLQ